MTISRFSELGLAEPAGVAFIPGAGELVTIGMPQGTELGRLTLLEDVVGAVAVDLQIPDPAAVAFDSGDDRLVFVDNESDEFVGLAGDGLRARGEPTVSRAGLAALSLGQVRGMAFDATDGSLIVLDATGIGVQGTHAAN